MKKRIRATRSGRVAFVLGAIAATAVVASLLASAGSARVGAVTPQAGQKYPVGVVMQGVCEWTTSADGSHYPVIGTYFQRWFQGAWSNASELPRQGQADNAPTSCTDRLSYPGKWRMRVFKSDGDITTKIVGPFYVVEGAVPPANPCAGNETKITKVETPNGGESGLEGLQGKHMSANQTLTAGADTNIYFGDGMKLGLSKGSSFKMTGCSPPRSPEIPLSIRLTLLLGKIWAKVPGHVARVQVSTQRVVAGNRGTIFWISYVRAGQVTTLHVDQGSAWMRALGATITLTAGHTATQKGTKAPVVRTAPINTRPPFG